MPERMAAGAHNRQAVVTMTVVGALYAGRSRCLCFAECGRSHGFPATETSA